MPIKFLKKIGISVFIIIGTVILIYLWNIVVIEKEDRNSTKPNGVTFIGTLDSEIAFFETNNNSDTTVIIIGGFMSWTGVWDRTISSVNESVKYNYIVLDLPPFGYSSVSRTGDYSRESQAMRIKSFIEMYKNNNKSVKNIILISHSYAAWPSLLLVSKYNSDKLINKFVIINGVTNLNKSYIGNVSFLVKNDLLRNIAVGVLLHSNYAAKTMLAQTVYDTTLIDSDESILRTFLAPIKLESSSKVVSQWLKDFLAGGYDKSETSIDFYKQINIPMRLVWGVEDTLTPIIDAEVIEKNLNDAKLYKIDSVGHMPMIENYEKFDEALIRAIVE